MTGNSNSAAIYGKFGNVALGNHYAIYSGVSTFASFQHVNFAANTGSYALMQNSSGQTTINSASGQPITFGIGNSEKIRMDSSGKLGIGTVTPGFPLDVSGSNSLSLSNHGGLHYNGSGTVFSSTGTITATISIRSSNDIYVSSGHFRVSSDNRIKKEIEDVDDSECLQTIRNIGVKKYKYVDPFSMGTDSYVKGFIAQDVSSLLPNSVRLTTKYIPNIYFRGTATLENTTTTDNSQTTLYTYLVTSTDSSNNIVLEKQQETTKINFYDSTDKEIKSTLIQQIDSNNIRVETEETLEADIFIYGEEIYDFNILDKNTIYTTAVGALQEIDRQQQIDKTEITNLKTSLSTLETNYNNLQNQYNNLLSRITALESN